MVRLEPLLEALKKTDAEEMRLEPGERIYVVKHGKRVPVGREPVQAKTLLQIASDSLGPLALTALDETPRQIERVEGSDRFALEFTRPNGTVHISIRRSASAVAQESPSEREGPPVPAAKLPPRAAPGHLDELLTFMVQEGASDLHLSARSCPVLRVHGEIRFLKDRGVLSSDEIRRLVYGILDEDTRKVFEDRRDADCAYEIPGWSRYRVNVFEDRKGVGASIRTIPVELLTVDQLGLPPSVIDLCFLTKGLVLVTGPTGSGKSTTLASMIDHINGKRSDHIITIEDPIEFVHENRSCLVNQRQVGRNTRSFKSALRAALREDPDIVLVGEMRDLETIGIAIETAETGHLVFGTLHTTTAVATVDRIIDQFPPDQQAQIRVMLADALKGVISQVLCRKKSGGRVAALEVLLGTSALASLIREGKTFQIPSIMQTSKRQGMITMNDSLFALVKEGLVEPREAWMKSTDKAQLLGLFKKEGFPDDFGSG